MEKPRGRPDLSCSSGSYNGAPTDGSAWYTIDDKTSLLCANRVLRGGAWLSVPGYLRSAVRVFHYSSDHRNDTIGFRVARTLAP